jgi:pimeloyl-ACP methyl ester carboxylesterase
MSQGNQEYLGDRLGEMQFRVLVIVGESDTRYVALAADMVRRLPAGRLAIVPGAPHNVVGSHPAELAGLVRWFLAEAPSP